jgi:hypothetical protein
MAVSAFGLLGSSLPKFGEGRALGRLVQMGYKVDEVHASEEDTDGQANDEDRHLYQMFVPRSHVSSSS